MTPALDTFFPYRRPPELDGCADGHHPVIVVGSGPIGLTMALDWVQRGHDVLVLAAGDSLSEGSRAICFAKRTLEICDRLGFGDALVDKGVSWNVGKVFRKNALLYEFNLLPEPGHERPAFVNLQQYYFEHFALKRLARCRENYSSTSDLPDAAGTARRPPTLATPQAHGAVDLRFNNRVTAVHQRNGIVKLSVECPDGAYTLTCDWLIACDGASSPVRKTLGLSSAGQVFRDRFLIADVKILNNSASLRNERWFWFDPPFHRNQSALLHRQADDVWRLDFQLGWEADPELEKQPEHVLPRIRAMLGEGVEFSLEWVSVYTFQCRRMQRFVHDHVIFAGDAAHQVSPFGARGANSGIQDVDNLGWKLDLVVRGRAPESLLATYSEERVAAADENIVNSTRSTDFITPKTDISRTFRDATLELAAKYPFARKLVNSGRLSVPAHYGQSSLNTPDVDQWPASTSMCRPGSPAPDAPIIASGQPDWLLRQLGAHFTAAVFCADAALPEDVVANLMQVIAGVNCITIIVARVPISVPSAVVALVDSEGIAFSRYAPGGKAIYIVRPDQHIIARRIGFSLDWIADAIGTARMTRPSTKQS